eukprot:scaffold250428_cov18-Tisochrysis_lutea.AAC.1
MQRQFSKAIGPMALVQVFGEGGGGACWQQPDALVGLAMFDVLMLTMFKTLCVFACVLCMHV